MAEFDDEFLGVASKPNPENEAYWRKRLANQGELRASPPKPLWRQFIETVEETFKRGPGALIGSYAAPLVETGDGKSYSERRKIMADKERQRREDYDFVNAPQDAGDYAAQIGGGIVGSLLSDPTNLIGGGAKTLGGKALNAAGIGGASDVALQGAEIASDLRDEYSPMQTGINVAAGPAFVAAGHAAGKGVDRYRETKGLKEAAILGRNFGKVTSLTRTPAHNKKVGGSKTSYHLSGRAMDIARGEGVSHDEIVAAFRKRGYNIVEALDEGDHTHLAFDFKTPAKPYKSGVDSLRELAEEGRQGTARSQAIGAVQEQDADFSPLISGRLYADNNPEIDALLAEGLDLRNQMTQIGDDLRAGRITPEEAELRNQQTIEAMDDRARRMQLYRLKTGLPVNEPELLGDNVAIFPGQKRPPVEDNTPDIDPQTGQPWGSPIYDDVLTPAERQDMDASISRLEMDRIRAQHPTSTTPFEAVGQGRRGEAANDLEAEPGQIRAGELYASGIGPGHSGGDGGGGEPPTLLQRLTTALEEAGSLKGEQAELMHAHKAKQALKMEQAAKGSSGRARLYAMRGAQKGAVERPGFDPIESKFSPEEIDTMSDYISEWAGWTSVYDSANALDGWNKLLKGEIPTNSELALLEKVLPREAITAILKHMPRDTAEVVADALNIPRSVLSSFDISAPGRQGVFLVGRKEWRQGLGDMIRQFGSEEAHQRIQQAIRDDPDFKLSEIAGLATQDTQVRLGGKEENFSSNLAEKYIPGVRASDRSFSGYLHKLRFDVFKSIIENHRDLGVDVNDPKYLKSLGTYLNNATGRGDLPKMLERWAPMLNATLFSPRLMASRLNLLANPVFWYKMHPKVRAEALKDLSKFSSVAVGILGLAAMNGAEISLDSNSSDFLKIKFGDRRYDILGGFQQYAVLGSRIATYLAGQTGLVDKKKGLEKTNLENAPLRFARTKLAPIPSAIVDSWLGKDVVGQDTTVLNEALGLVTPMSAGDIAEAAYDDGLLEGVFATPSLGGVGYAKYEEKVNKKDLDKIFLGTDTVSDEEFLSGKTTEDEKDEEFLK